MMKIQMYNEVATVRTMSARAIKIALNKLAQANEPSKIGSVIRYTINGNIIKFEYQIRPSSWKVWVPTEWAQAIIIETAEVETAEVETAEVETAEVETAEVETVEVETAPTATVIAEYIWTFTPTADGKTLWNSERVR